MLWLLSFLVLIAVSLTQTTPDSQNNALNNLAALESAEKILKTIDDLTTSTTPATPLPVTTTETVTEEASTNLVEDTTNVLLDDRRRAGGGGVALPMQAIYNTDSGLRVLMEIKRRMQDFLKNPTVNSALSQHVFTYGVPGQSLYLNNAFQPQVEVTSPPSYVYNPPVQQGVPLQYAKQLQDLPVYANLEQNIRKGNFMNFVQYSQTPQKTYEVTLPSQPRQRIRPAQNIPAQSTPIPMWMLLALQEMQGRRPMDSPSVAPQHSEQALYAEDALLATIDSPDVIEEAFQADNAKAMSMSEWQQPQPPFPTLYFPPPTEAPPPIATQTRGPTLTVSLLPLTMAPQSPKKTRPKNRQLPVAVTGRLRVNPLLPANAWMSLKALASVKTRLVTQPRAPSSSRMVLNFQSRLPQRLPTTKRNRFNLVSVKNKPPAESLLKLTNFMRANRDTLLQFIAMKRNLLLEQKKGTIAHGNAYQNSQTRNAAVGGKKSPNRSPNIAALIQNSNRASGNVIGEKKQAVRVKGLGSKGDTTNFPAAQAVARALPQEFPGSMLDLAPGKGSKIWHMRYKNRICQRNVMLLSGPKYDRKARVIKREFRPGVDRRVFRVTKRKKMLLPACCNCCKKSVLGCE